MDGVNDGSYRGYRWGGVAPDRGGGVPVAIRVPGVVELVMEVHCPVVAGVVVGSLKQRQEVHPGVSSAVEEQQQRFKHRLLAQSKLVLQVSPGE